MGLGLGFVRQKDISRRSNDDLPNTDPVDGVLTDETRDSRRPSGEGATGSSRSSPNRIQTFIGSIRHRIRKRSHSSRQDQGSIETTLADEHVKLKCGADFKQMVKRKRDSLKSLFGSSSEKKVEWDPRAPYTGRRPEDENNSAFGNTIINLMYRSPQYRGYLTAESSERLASSQRSSYRDPIE